MASRVEKTTRRVAGRVREATKTAAAATRRASQVLDRVEVATRGLDSPRNIKKASRAAEKLAKSAAVGMATVGLRRAVDAVGKKLGRRKPSRRKKALKVAGTVAAVAGAVVIVRQVVKSKKARTSPSPALEPEQEMERGPAY